MNPKYRGVACLFIYLSFVPILFHTITTELTIHPCMPVYIFIQQVNTVTLLKGRLKSGPSLRVISWSRALRGSTSLNKCWSWVRTRRSTAGLQSLPVSQFYSWEGKGLLSSTGELRGIHRMRGPAQSPTASPTLCPRLKGLAA